MLVIEDRRQATDRRNAHSDDHCIYDGDYPADLCVLESDC